MTHLHRILINKYVLGTGLAAVLSTVCAQDTSSVTLSGSTLMTGTTVTVEVFDDVCKRSIGQFSVSGPNGSTTVGPLCLSASGYMTLRRRLVPNGVWYGKSYMKPGDPFDPS